MLVVQGEVDEVLERLPREHREAVARVISIASHGRLSAPSSPSSCPPPSPSPPLSSYMVIANMQTSTVEAELEATKLACLVYTCSLHLPICAADKTGLCGLLKNTHAQTVHVRTASPESR